MRVNGQLGPYEAEVCRKGLNQRGEKLVPAGEDRPDPGHRRALALTTLCQDELDQNPASAPPGKDTAPSPPGRREPLLMVVAHQPVADQSNYEQGIAVLAGGRVGPDTVDLITCEGRVEAITTDGRNIGRHGTVSGIPPSLRRAVLARDDGCTIDGWTSVYRLEVHHIHKRSEGGGNTPDNLTTLCWWHHHVAVHRRGMRIDPQTPPQRRRLLPTRQSYSHQPPTPNPHTLAILRILEQHTNRAPP